MGSYTVTVDLAGTLTEEQMMAAGEEGVRALTVEEDRNATHLWFPVEADDAKAAVRRGWAAFEKIGTVNALVQDGRLEVTQFTVMPSKAYEVTLPVMSTKAVAERLGLTDARVRQLSARDRGRQARLGFPRALRIPGAAGEFYLRVQVEEYARMRDREGVHIGRPRKMA